MAPASEGLDREPAGTPRWAKVLGGVVLVVVLLIVVLHLTGLGPGVHAP